MNNMPLMTVSDHVVESPTTSSPLNVQVEEFARGRRVTLGGTHASWVLVLPTDGFEFESMQYQISADDAARSAVLELKMEGGAYRQAVAGVNRNATAETILDALRVLLQPVLPLLGLMTNDQDIQNHQPFPLYSVTG